MNEILYYSGVAVMSLFLGVSIAINPIGAAMFGLGLYLHVTQE